MTARIIRRTSAVLFCALLCAAWASGSPVMAQSSALARKAPLSSAIQAEISRSGTAPIIVELDAPAASSVDPSTAAKGRTSIRSLQDAVLSSALRLSASRLSSRTVKRTKIMPTIALEVSSAELERLAADPRVKTIHLDRLMEPQLAETVPLIGATNSVLVPTGNDSIVVVLDSGVWGSHKFLAGKVLGEACFSTTRTGFRTLCPNGLGSQIGPGAAAPCTVIDRCNHGTYVAGIAAGRSTSTQPERGVASGASIFAIQIFSYNTAEKKIQGFSSDNLAALDHVLDMRSSFPGKRIDAVNMSLSTPAAHSGACDSDPLAPVIGQLRAAGIATVVASGNDGSTNLIGSPGCITAAITVGASTMTDTIWEDSNLSPVVDVLAPGSVDITSSTVTYNPVNRAIMPVSLFRVSGGTSAAAPHVAGALAILRNRYPFSTVAELETLLRNTGRAITDNRPGGTLTRPRIQVQMAALALPRPTISVTGPQLAFAPNMFGGFAPASIELTIRATGGTAAWKLGAVPAWLTVSVSEGQVGVGGLNVIRISPSPAARSLGKAATATLIFFNQTVTTQTPINMTVSIKAPPSRI
jgi:subtilisin family serine protease